MKNKNVDIIRALALLLVLFYHAWVVCDSFQIKNQVVLTIIMLGGEIGVTTFFLLSGYGIYCSLRNSENKGSVLFFEFMKKRMLRVAPQYYLSLLVVLLFGSGVYYLAYGEVWNIITHILFIHNLSHKYSGAINGALWTMGIIVQFYTVAILLYKGIKKGGLFFWLATIVFTIVMKAIVFEYFLSDEVSNTSMNFIYGRQLYTALDNFTTGMFVAHIFTNNKLHIKKLVAVMATIMSVVLLYYTCRLGLVYGIHTNNWSGYIWHSILASCIGAIMLFFSYVPLIEKNSAFKTLIWISKYEYGVYLWHLVLFFNLKNAQLIQALLIKDLNWVVVAMLMIVALGIGYLFSVLTDTFMKTLIKKEESSC